MSPRTEHWVLLAGNYRGLKRAGAVKQPLWPAEDKNEVVAVLHVSTGSIPFPEECDESLEFLSDTPSVEAFQEWAQAGESEQRTLSFLMDAGLVLPFSGTAIPENVLQHFGFISGPIETEETVSEPLPGELTVRAFMGPRAAGAAHYLSVAVVNESFSRGVSVGAACELVAETTSHALADVVYVVATDLRTLARAGYPLCLVFPS